jgi:(4S)-4-hydroxy-5-phosphonooxypentane-2,3-dione isomerase
MIRTTPFPFISSPLSAFPPFIPGFIVFRVIPAAPLHFLLPLHGSVSLRLTRGSGSLFHAVHPALLWIHPRTPDRIMIIVHVSVHVLAGQVDAFRAGTLENAARSLEEPGVVRFDVIQEADDPHRFLLVEVYRTTEDPARHKETTHYATWRDAVEPMMAEPRRSVRYHAVFPDAEKWQVPG